MRKCRQLQRSLWLPESWPPYASVDVLPRSPYNLNIPIGDLAPSLRFVICPHPQLKFWIRLWKQLFKERRDGVKQKRKRCLDLFTISVYIPYFLYWTNN